MKFDDILREIGEFGWYQRRVYVLACLPVIFIAFEAVSSVFIFNIPAHRCAIPGYEDDQYHVTNDTHTLLLNHAIPKENGRWSQCSVYSNVTVDVIAQNGTNATWMMTAERTAVDMNDGTQAVSKCQKWVYGHSVFESTIATDFNVVCERSVLRSTSNMWSEVGTVVGVFVSGLLADRFGRKVPFYLGAVVLIGGGFGIAFTRSLLTLNICRFMLGMARMALWTNCLVIALEITGPSWRVFAGVFIEFVWCVGLYLLLLFAFLIRQWRYLEIAVSVPSCVLLTYWWLIPESPRWLASKGREQEAVDILKKITSSNHTQLPTGEDVGKSLVEKESSLNFRQVFQSRELIVRMLVIFSNMFTLNVIYYALLYNMTNLAGDLFINYLINVVLETVGLVSPYFILDRFGRKRVYCVSVLAGGIACVASVVPALVEAPDWIVVALSMVGRFFVCVGFTTIYIYGAELFPTVIRASAMSVSVTFARVGSIISPYIADVGILFGGRLMQALPLIVMGSPALLIGLSSLWLPETTGTKMPETLDDVSNAQSKGSCLCCKKRSTDEKEQSNARELKILAPEIS